MNGDRFTFSGLVITGVMAVILGGCLAYLIFKGFP
jgi:hypothetical protein